MSTPVTEQFLSAARTQTLLDGKAPLDHTHEGGGATGNSGTLLGTSVGFSSAGALTTQDAPDSGSRFVLAGGWTFFDDQGEGAGLVPGTEGWGYANPGLYVVTIALSFGIVDAVPPYVRLRFNTYWGDSWVWTVPCYPPDGLDARTLQGTATTVHTSMHYAPAQEDSGLESNQIEVRWAGTDGTFKNPSGTGPSGSTITVYVARYATL